MVLHDRPFGALAVLQSDPRVLSSFATAAVALAPVATTFCAAFCAAAFHALACEQRCRHNLEAGSQPRLLQ